MTLINNYINYIQILRMFHHLDFPRLFLCESTGYSKHKTTGIASVAICGGSNHILTGLLQTIAGTNLCRTLIACVQNLDNGSTVATSGIIVTNLM